MTNTQKQDNVNMLAKNEDSFISSLWGKYSTNSIDKLSDVLIYFSKNKSYQEARTEWVQLIEYLSPRPRVCICGRENTKTLYIRNVYTNAILRIGKECIYRFNFPANNTAKQMDATSVPLENICIECHLRHVGN